MEEGTGKWYLATEVAESWAFLRDLSQHRNLSRVEMVFQQWKDEIRSCGVDRVSHQGIKFCGRDHEIITANLVDSSIKLVREEPSLPHPECREIRFEGEHAGFANVFKLELYQVFTRSVHAQLGANLTSAREDGSYRGVVR